MCGVAGIIKKNPTRGLKEQYASRFLEAIKSRGPDGAGVFADEKVCLVHSRLSIIDLASGAQPLWSWDNESVIVYNGELFNYKEIRRELESFGHKFKTHSDTDVFLAAYQQWGESFFEHLDGEFAAAIYTPKKNKIILCRDRFGIRPLYYKFDNNQLVFGSALAVLHRASDTRPEFDSTTLQHQFLSWAPPVGRTPFKNCMELPARSFLTLDTKTWEYKIKKYWSIPELKEKSEFSQKDAVLRFEELMEKAIQRRLVADVEVGAYLSGGIDSSYLCAYVSKYFRENGKRLHTFSIEFEDRKFDESSYQRDLAQRLDTIHHPLTISDQALVDAIPSATAAAEIPSFRLAYVPMFLLSKTVRDAGIKCILSGEGADELLLGYEIFKESKIRKFWNREPESKARPLLLKKLYSYLTAFEPRFMSLTIEYYRKHQKYLNIPGWGHTIRWDSLQLLDTIFAEPMWKDLDSAVGALAETLVDRPEKQSSMTEVRNLEVQTLLSGYLLSTQGDRMAMAHGVEARPVYLSHELWDGMAKFSASHLASGLRDKLPLRSAAQKYLPDNFAKRPKNPYRAPDAYSIMRLKPDWVMDLFTEARLKRLPFINSTKARQFVEQLAKKAPETISLKQNSAFIFLLTTLVLDDNLRKSG